MNATSSAQHHKNVAPIPSVLDKYLIAEVLPVLLGGLIISVLLLVLAALFEVAAPIISKGANPLLVLQLLAFKMPYAFARGLPFALLFAVLLTLSRLSQDSELKAAVVHGIAPERLAWPILALGLISALLSFFIGQVIAPRGQAQALSVMKDIVLQNPKPFVSEGQFFKDGQGQHIYIAPGGIGTSGELHNITIIQTQTGQVPMSVIRAPAGKIMVGEGAIELTGGSRITYRGGNPRPVTIAKFTRAIIPIKGLQDGNMGTQELPVDLPLGDLTARIKDYKQRGFNTRVEETALWRKFAEPAAAIAFALFGVAMAMFTLRSNQSLGILGVIFLTFFYYATWTVFRVMGENGAMSPFLAAWTPTLLYALAGVALLSVARQR